MADLFGPDKGFAEDAVPRKDISDGQELRVDIKGYGHVIDHVMLVLTVMTIGNYMVSIHLTVHVHVMQRA